MSKNYLDIVYENNQSSLFFKLLVEVLKTVSLEYNAKKELYAQLIFDEFSLRLSEEDISDLSFVDLKFILKITNDKQKRFLHAIIEYTLSLYPAHPEKLVEIRENKQFISNLANMFNKDDKSVADEFYTSKNYHLKSVEAIFQEIQGIINDELHNAIKDKNDLLKKDIRLLRDDFEEYRCDNLDTKELSIDEANKKKESTREFLNNLKLSI